MTQPAQGRFLALGDSYTIGESVPPSERWPVQLAGLLREAGLPVQDPEIIARTGWTTDELSAAIDAAAPGDVLRLAPGTHRGPVVIDRALVQERVGLTRRDSLDPARA